MAVPITLPGSVPLPSQKTGGGGHGGGSGAGGQGAAGAPGGQAAEGGDGSSTMAFSFSTSASEAEAAVNARASAGAAAAPNATEESEVSPPPAVPSNSLLEVAAGDPIPPSSSGRRGKSGWDPSRLSTVAEVGDKGSAATAQSVHGKANIGWDSSRVGIGDKTVASNAVGRASVEAPGENRATIGWDVSRVGFSSSSDNTTSCHEALRDGKRTDVTSAGSGSSKTKIGWDPSRADATTAGQPAAGGGGGGEAALSSPQQQGELEGEVAAGVGEEYLTTTPASAGRPRVPHLSLSLAERGEQEQLPPPTEQQQQHHQQTEPRPRIGWDPTRMSATVAVPAKDALPSTTQPFPATAAPTSCNKATVAADKIAQEMTGMQPLPTASTSTTAVASTGEERANTAPRQIGWNASRVGNPATPAPTMNSKKPAATMEAVAGVASGAEAGIGWNASRVAKPIAPAPVIGSSVEVLKAVGVAGAETTTAAETRIGWNASRVGNPTVPAPVMNKAAAPTVAGAVDVATAVTAAVAAGRRAVAGREGGEERAAPVGGGGSTRRTGVPLQLRAVLLYASTQRGIDLRKWFNLGGGGDESVDEDEDETQEGGEGEIGGGCNDTVLSSVIFVGRPPVAVAISASLVLTPARVSDCQCLVLPPPFPRVGINPSGHRGPNHFDDGPIQAGISGIGGRPQGDCGALGWTAV